MTGRVEGRTVTASSRGVRGRHSTSDLPATPTYLAHGFHHGTDIVYDPYLHVPIIRPCIPYRSATQEPILEFIGQSRQIWTKFFAQMFGAVPQDSSCSTHGYSHAKYGVSSSVPYIPRPANRDEGDYAGDEEQLVPVAHASGSDGRSRHEKGRGLTGSFMSVMSKIAESRNKRPEVAREVSALTQKRKKVKPSDWEQTCPAEGGPVDPELLPSYGGYVAGSWFIEVPVALYGTHRAACYLQYILGSSLFNDKSGNIVPVRLWLLLQDVSSVGRFSCQLSLVAICSSFSLNGCPHFFVS
ncbi:hypothetical protein M9H77_20853 [Catharanthus roseus]|uniref:Uncharacterized protein n=1 Tax=Catharanthus roseus TaxID=4058 RepID=A0ACC0AMC4_CATRO|nr:hypothetical protein M9H77_20853 [Catharanthus roseus]